MKNKGTGENLRTLNMEFCFFLVQRWDNIKGTGENPKIQNPVEIWRAVNKISVPNISFMSSGSQWILALNQYKIPFR
jgi:hypothetical protein